MKKEAEHISGEDPPISAEPIAATVPREDFAESREDSANARPKGGQATTTLNAARPQAPTKHSMAPNEKHRGIPLRRVEMLSILSRHEASLRVAVSRTLNLLHGLKAARPAAEEDALTVYAAPANGGLPAPQ